MKKVFNLLNGNVAWAIACLLILLSGYLVYKPALNGPFVFDDGINIVSNAQLRIDRLTLSGLKAAAFSVPNGLFARPLSMLSFALNCYFDNCASAPFLNPFVFKASNLAIHLFNGLLLAFLVRQLAGPHGTTTGTTQQRHYANYLALAVSAAWLLHPFALTGVLYVVQRMASLSALFCLAGMVSYLWGRQRHYLDLPGGKTAMLATALLFTPLSVLAKETGLLMPVYILLIEYFFFKLQSKDGLSKFALTFIGIYSVLPVVLGIYYIATHGAWILNGYALRDFTLNERLLTEARVFWFYIGQILIPNVAGMGMFHDDFIVSQGLLQPVSTLFSLAGIVAMVWLAWIWRIKHALVSFGLLFYVAGQSMESSFIPLELIHEHRNYLPMVGILLSAGHGILGPDWGTRVIIIRRAFVCLMIALFCAITSSRVQDWSGAEALWLAETSHHPESIRAQVALGDFYAGALNFDPIARQEQVERAGQAYVRALAIDPANIGAQISLLKFLAGNAKPVPGQSVDAAVAALSTQTLPANLNDHLIAIANCTGGDGCTLKPNDAERLILAAIANPKTTPHSRALIYSAAIYFYAEISNDYEKAMQSARAAVALDPDLNYQLWIAAIYIDMKMPHEASDQLALIERMDIQKTKVKDLEALRGQIADIR